ncbi:hypothetical protein [Streptomyces sp. NPDC046161]|uniref:hypothetical protein n=1 Tax=Streptomyces sp. NPDC046161 TaxID=3155132 RepID=UPI0033DB1817
MGDLNLLTEELRTLADADLRLLNRSLMRWTAAPLRPDEVVTHTQAALSAKAAITATGMLAATAGLPIADAARALHDYSRATNTRPMEATHALIRRTPAPDTVLRRTTNAEANPASA